MFGIPLSAFCLTASLYAQVSPGVEQFLADVPSALRGKRVGLITNHTGVDSRGVSIIDRLSASRDVRLVALFAPEHGIRGTAADGEKIASSVDKKTRLPIFSLYGATRKPTPRMLARVDALLFDMQDVGARPYTYISTMALAMRAAKEKGIPFVVLDRPNPIGGHLVEGNVLDTAFRSFVGMYPIAIRHGMTIGELAGLFNYRFGIGAKLLVVPMRGWRRDMWFDETGLPWISPSPNIRRLETAIHYPGTVFIEATNLSEGRGSDLPLEQAGAPWLRGREVADSMNAMQLRGVRFEVTRFTPSASKYRGRPLPAVRFVITDRETYRPVRAALLFIDLVRRLHPNDFRWEEGGAGLDRLAGTDELRKAIENGSLKALLLEWEDEALLFRAKRRGDLRYFEGEGQWRDSAVTGAVTPIRTDRLEYAPRGTPPRQYIVIEATFTNLSSDTVYIRWCRGHEFPRFALEEYSAGEWRAPQRRYGMLTCTDMAVPPLAVPPNDWHTSYLELGWFTGPPPGGHLDYLKLSGRTLRVVYTEVYRTAARSPAPDAKLPKELRVSNAFRVLGANAP